ncbi:FAR1-related sequence 5-like protein [Tanacetum coccineum]
MEADELNDVMGVVKNIDMNKQFFEYDNELESDTEDVLPQVADSDALIEEVTGKAVKLASLHDLTISIRSYDLDLAKTKTIPDGIAILTALVTDCIKTPRATLYEQNETPGGTIYWEPHVQGIPIPVEGTYYDTVDEAIDMYTKYAEMGGFEVKKSGQRLTKSGVVKHKYIMCNREGVPKGINVDTLDPEHSDKQKRNTTTHVTGCKARIKLVLDIVSRRYKLDQFYPKHNHMLIPKEYKHYTKKQRKMTEAEKMFVVKAATNKIGATRAHDLLSSMKGGYEYVHGTTDAFKNHQRDVNVFIENSELVAMFWADEVAKCNYKEFGDIVSFDATFNSNKYYMKFVPFIGVDNHRKEMGKLIEDFGLQNHKWMTKMFNLREIWIPAYFIESPLFGLMRTTSRSESENSFFKSFTSPGATLVSFMMSYESAMERQEALDFKTIDIAPKCETKLAIEHHAARVYTRTIFLLVQKEIIEGCWSCTIQDLKINEGCETVIVRDKAANAYRTLNAKKGKEQEKEIGTVAEIVIDYKNRDINVIPKQYILRRWTRDIIPPDLRRQRNRYGEKIKDEGKMGAFVEKLKILMDEVKADVPNPPSRNTGDVIGGIFSISKPNQIDVQNPTKAINKGEHLKKGERLKSKREQALKVKAKAMKVCGYCNAKTNEHTKTTCPKNPKARKKKATPIIDV